MKRSSKLLFSIPFFLTNTSVSEAAEALMRRSGAAIQNSVFAVYRTPFTNTAVRGVFSSTRILEASRQKKPTEEISLAGVKSQVKRMEKNVNAKTLKLNKELLELSNLRADLERLSISSQKLKGKDYVSSEFSSGEDEYLMVRGGRYLLSPKEIKRIDRVYELLNSYARKSITHALRGASKGLCATFLQDFKRVIEQLSEEAKQEGETRDVDHKYLMKLYWAREKYDRSARVSPFSEQEDPSGRLMRLYGLLPEYGAKSVTHVLKNPKYRPKGGGIWTDLLDAIHQIVKESEHKGEKDVVDIHYFRTLYASAIERREALNKVSDSALKLDE